MDPDTYVVARAEAFSEGDFQSLLDRRRVHWNKLNVETRQRFNTYLLELLRCYDAFIVTNPGMASIYHDRSFQAIENFNMALNTYGIECFHPQALRKPLSLGSGSAVVLASVCQACKLTLKADLCG